MEISKATRDAGFVDCLSATVHKDNIPTYVGIGGGLIGGNAVGKAIDNYYVDNSDDPNRWLSLVLRTTGRAVISAGACALSGSYEEGSGEKKTLQMAAVGSLGFVAIDIIREFGRDPDGADPSWIDDYLTLQVPRRRAVTRPSRGTPVRAAPRPVSLQDNRSVALQNARPAMEAAALAPRGDGRPMMETASLTSTSGASL